MKYAVMYNGKMMARCMYFYEANLIYEDLVERGRMHESIYPFRCELIFNNDVDKRYETPSAVSNLGKLTAQDVQRMKEEYGM